MTIAELVPHRHSCRAFSQGRRHDNSYPCFDTDPEERKHAGYFEACLECLDLLHELYPDTSGEEV